MTRIIIDLTEFRTWSGHLTGVQRVVYGLAKALQETDAEIEYVTFDKSFQTVDFHDFLNIVMPKEQAATSLDVMTGFRHKAKTILRKVYHRSPAVMKSYLTPIRKDKLKRAAISTYSRARKLKDVKQYRHKVMDTTAAFRFRPGDVLVSAGRAWDSEAYVASLESVKREQGVRLAYVVYDLIPIYQQHTFGQGLTERYSCYLYSILKHADYLFPISKSTERDLRKFADEIGVLKLPEIEVIRLGDDVAEKEGVAPPSFIQDPHSFTMCVGTIEARKNHIEIYYAYKLAEEKGITLPDMYIIGKPGWLTGDLLYFLQHDITIKDKITIVHNVSDGDLAWMYRHALFTVYPSQYEGWGLPIAESLALGTPCVASNTSSMVEIAPKLVDYISPFDTSELLERMAYYAKPENSNKRRKEIEKAYSPYKWSATAKTILRLALGTAK